MAALLPKDEEARLAALHARGILDTASEDAYDDITRLAAFVCGTPIAAVTFVAAEREWFKSIVGLSVTEFPRGMSFCTHTILQRGLMVVPDALEDARFADNPLVIGEPKIRFYAGMPLVTEEGHALGSLCVIDRVPRRLTFEQEEALRTLARQVTAQLELARRVTQQERLIAEREQSEEQRRQGEDALRQKEKRLIEAQRIGGIGDWELDVAAQMFTWSAGVFRLMEFDPAEGTPPYEVVQTRYHPDDRAERDRLLARALETGEPYQCEIRLILPSGAPRCCRLVGQPEKNADGKVVRVAGTLLDITESVARERQSRDASAILAVQRTQLEAYHEELTAMASTDPLTGLLNYRAFQARFAQETARAPIDESVLAAAVLDVNDFRLFNDLYGHAVGDAVLRLVAARLSEVWGESGVVARFGSDEFTVLLPGMPPTVTPAEVEARLRTGLGGLSYLAAGEGTPIPIAVSVGAALLLPDSPGDDAARAEALQLAGERLRRAMTGGAAETEADRVRASALLHIDGFSMLDALVTAVDNKDRYTRKHSEDVMDYSLMAAWGLGMGEKEWRAVAVAALLHDVGKIGVPDKILRKPGTLTNEEFAAVRQHPMMGAIIVQAVPGLEETLDAVRHHHERWDGEGYPFGLRGEETPLIARLMAVADAFSAMTTDRPYRRGMNREKAMSILEAGAGSQWDPTCVRAFLKGMARDQNT